MSAIKIIVTSDGSHSLLNESLNETYHSVHGAIQESEHVFIQNGLGYFLKSNSPARISILEVGFGTGLNALLTLRRIIQSSVKCTYTTMEAFPLGEGLWTALNYPRTIGFQEFFTGLHSSSWGKISVIMPRFELLKHHITIQEIKLPAAAFDIIYFDAFAPNKQPELWTIDILRKIVDAMSTNGVFVTYSAKGQLKRDLKTLGLNVETLAGPPGKKEMVRAVKNKV